MIKSSNKSLGGSEFFYRLIRAVLFITYKCLFRFEFYGTEKVPLASDDRGVILAPNHASYLDPPLLGISLKRRVTYLAKEYLFEHFFVGWVLRSIGAYPIKSKTDDFRSIRDLIRILHSGHCLAVFPEGTRSLDGNFKEPEGGVGFLAMKSKAHVVPVYIQGTYEILPPAEGGSASGGKGAKGIRMRPIKIYFGDAFIPVNEPAFLNAESHYPAVSEMIMQKIKALKHSVENFDSREKRSSSLNQ